jgi:phage terminase large subunit GpA-like protein
MSLAPKEAICSSHEALVVPFFRGLKPDPAFKVSEWSAEFRVLSQKASAQPGRWRNERTPYLVEIMDCLSPHAVEEEVIFMKGAQVGGTESGSNWTGYVIDAAPGPMLLVQPTVDLAKRFSKQRLEPMIQECPRLQQKIRTDKAKDSGNTLLMKEFPGGYLVLTGANSAVGLRSMPARYLFLDEVDAYPGDVDGEGDPVSLAKARTRTFARRKVLQVSTPTIHGTSRIESSYEASDKRRFFLPCPHCGHMQHLRWAQMKWENHDPRTAHYECEECKGSIEEKHKTTMLAAGRWIATNPGAKGGKVAGFHLSSLYSPVGWYSWEQAVADWLDAQGNTEKMRGFVNTVLGETWMEKGDAPEWRRIMERREPYPIGQVPMGGLLLFLGGDVQKDRIEAEVVAYGAGLESWSVAYEIFEGDTATEAPWIKFEAFLSTQFKHESGHLMPIYLAAIDTSAYTQVVYNWLRKQMPNKIFGVKGMDNLPMSLGASSPVDVNFNGTRIRRGLRIRQVGVSHLKRELYSFLKLEKPLPGDAPPPGFCHFPEYPQQYFQGLCAEQLIQRKVRGFAKHIWHKIFERNEPLDCRVYARAAAAAAGVDRMLPDDWLALKDQYRKKDGDSKAEKADTSAGGVILVDKPNSFWS